MSQRNLQVPYFPKINHPWNSLPNFCFSSKFSRNTIKLNLSSTEKREEAWRAEVTPKPSFICSNLSSSCWNIPRHSIVLHFNFRAVCCASKEHMFLIWTPAVKQNSGLAGTGSPEGQRPRAYILVSPHPCGNQKPRSGHQCLRQARVRLDLLISATHRARLTFRLEFRSVFVFQTKRWMLFYQSLGPRADT